jgi:hypothetical protein
VGFHRNSTISSDPDAATSHRTVAVHALARPGGDGAESREHLGDEFGAEVEQRREVRSVAAQLAELLVVAAGQVLAGQALFADGGQVVDDVDDLGKELVECLDVAGLGVVRALLTGPRRRLLIRGFGVRVPGGAPVISKPPDPTPAAATSSGRSS